MKMPLWTFLFFPGIARVASLAATLSSDGSQSDVQAKINAASDGDTVTIPAGSFTWSSGVSISGKAIHIQGNGARRVLARSDSSVQVGTGTKVFTLITESIASIEALKDEITDGATLRIWRAGGEIDVNQGAGWQQGITGNLPWMEGTVTSISGTTLTMNITSSNDTGIYAPGTYAPWIIVRPASTTITLDSGSYLTAVSITERVGGSVRLSGIHFEHNTMTNDNYFVLISPTSGGSPVLIHDCSFNPIASGMVGIRAESTRGVVWNCSFLSLPASYGSSNGMSIKPTSIDTWASTSTMGTADSDGTSNLYVEDSDFHFMLDCADGSDNARVVFRNCLFNNSGLGMHGADTAFYGVRHFEIYSNQFVFSNPGAGTNAYNIQGFVIPRGGTGVIYQNAFVDINSPSSWGDKTEILFQIQPLSRNAGPNGLWSDNDGQVPEYPVPRQIGLGRVTGTGLDGKGRSTDPNAGQSWAGAYVGDSEPLYVWGNSGTFGVGVDGSNYGDAIAPDLASDYIQAGRDYYNNGTAKPGWTAYTYPHPLRGESVATFSITGTLTVTGTITLE